MKSMSLILIKIRYFLRLIGVKVKKTVVKDLNELNSFWLIRVISCKKSNRKSKNYSFLLF